MLGRETYEKNKNNASIPTFCYHFSGLYSKICTTNLYWWRLWIFNGPYGSWWTYGNSRWTSVYQRLHNHYSRWISNKTISNWYSKRNHFLWSNKIWGATWRSHCYYYRRNSYCLLWNSKKWRGLPYYIYSNWIEEISSSKESRWQIRWSILFHPIRSSIFWRVQRIFWIWFRTI